MLHGETLEDVDKFKHLDWVKVSSELAQELRAWSASVRDVVNAIGDAGLTRPGECRRKYK